MKKILFVILLFVSSAILANGSNLYAPDDEKDPIQELEIKAKKENALNDGYEPRQVVLPAVEALLYCNSGEIVFTFNENIGEVVITVTNGNDEVVATSVCNSATSSVATVFVPTTAGAYTIEIAGDQYSGSGEYVL